MGKILIIGSTGFIGRNLREQLASDHEIVAPSHNELDLLDGKRVLEFLENQKFDVVIHSATHNATRNSKVDVNRMFYNNLRMFFNLVRGSKYYGRMLYFGSGAEYDRKIMPPKVEENFFGSSVPDDDYGFSKYISNLTAAKSDNIFNLTVFGCFGKYEDWEIRFISNAICKTLFDLPITIRQDVYFDYLYINDLVKIVKWFIEAPNLKYKKYNICTGKTINLLSLAKTALEISGKKLKIEVAQEGLDEEYSGDNRRLMSEMGDFEFTPIEQAVKELYGWYKVNQNKIDRNLLLADK